MNKTILTQIKFIPLLQFFAVVSFLLFSKVALGETVLGLENFKFSGDFRYRHQATRTDGAPDRYRDRIRLRLGAKFDLEEKVKAQFRFASGESGDTALSTNQSLGNGGEKKSIWIDQAFLKFQPTEAWDLRLGKIQNIWWEPNEVQLVFDEDYTPEGFSGEWVSSHPESQGFVGLHAHWLKERRVATVGETSTDVAFLGSQLGWRFQPYQNKITLAASYMALPNLKGTPALHSDNNFSGNSIEVINAVNVYAQNFEVVTFGAEWIYLGGLDEPITLVFSGAQNLRTQKNNQAATAGFAFGTIKEKGDWVVGYRYRYAEADSLLSALSDSDLGSSTDTRVHVLYAKHGLTQKLSLSATFYQQDLAMAGNAKDFQRIHLDLVAKF